MKGNIPPHDLDAEASVLGAMLLRPMIIRDLKGSLDPGDFYKSSNGWVYLSILQLHDDGLPIDIITVSDQLKAQSLLDEVGGTQYLIELQNTMPSVSAFGMYAEIVIDHSRKRRAIEALSGMIDEAYQRGSSIDSVLKQAEQLSSSKLIGARQSEIADLYDVYNFAALAAAQEADHPWQVEHIAKALWRTILVAPEGIGKAVLMRYIAAHAAAGRDVWAPEVEVEKRRVLYVDVENPMETIMHQIRIANTRSEVDLVAEGAEHFFIWHREGGMNLRDRRVQAEFESVLHKVQPEMVFAGPLYKLYRRSQREDQEQAALEFTEILDDFRTRFGFSLMLEHHAPKAQGGGFRDLNPFGSSLFMRWPEIGLTLDFDGQVGPDEPDYTLKVGRFRRDRVLNDWPNLLERNRNFSLAWRPRWHRGRGAKLAEA